MKPSHSKQILIVEDEPSLASALLMRLKKREIDSVVTASGKEALEIIKAKGEPFDGIWLDFDVYDYDGLELMKRFVKIKDWEKSPVLIVSNTADPELVQKTIDLGAKKWILKAEANFDDIIDEFIKLMEDAKKADGN